jgi:hypothetical protein
MVKEACPCCAATSPACSVPFTTPGPNPVTAVPAHTPRSPLIRVRPVLVTVLPARTANCAADPRSRVADVEDEGVVGDDDPHAVTRQRDSRASSRVRDGGSLPIRGLQALEGQAPRQPPRQE